jgi:hypothetical protein
MINLMDKPNLGKFANVYTIKLNELNIANISDDTILYTKISLIYALANNIPYINLLFHPKSVLTRKYYEHPILDQVKETLEAIIIHETSEEKTYLTAEELEATIKHFRTV